MSLSMSNVLPIDGAEALEDLVLGGKHHSSPGSSDKCGKKNLMIRVFPDAFLYSSKRRLGSITST